ncbi:MULTISPECIES: arginase family protein [Paraliobacillus]|uniref:arginase family protein n=1 Tax=Paraliobacillus TaxID=200903 RepID=UPI000DD45C24|nr:MULTISPECIES: arginase family protein [Paraliobacillus]
MGKPKYILEQNKQGELFISDDKLESFWKTEKNHITKDLIEYKEDVFFNFPGTLVSNKNVVNIIGVPYSGGSNQLSSAVDAFPTMLRYLSTKTPIYPTIDGVKTSGIFDINKLQTILDDCLIRDLGNIDFKEFSVEELESKVKSYIKNCIENKSKFSFIGGDHSITYYILKNLQLGERNVTYIHLDAHLDCGMDPFRLDNDIHHGNFVRHLLTNNIVDQVIQLGVRGMRAIGQYYQDPRLHTIPSKYLNKESVNNLLREHIDTNTLVYVSFDVDVLDPSDFPDVDFPSPGGPSIDTVLDIIECFHSIPNLIGFDFVEGKGTSAVDDIPYHYDLLSYIYTRLLNVLSKNKFTIGG